MRLIDADALVRSMSVRLKELADEYGWYDHYVTGLDDAITYIDDAPAIDAAPVVHARWIEPCINKYGHPCHHCSACRFKASQKDRNYCPNCGAKMRGETDEE